ncbi:MAG: DUF6538 domain-containing protein [Mariprofundales bacterium]
MARKRLNYLHSGEYYIYYYRRAIPITLRKALGGRREIKLSLGTRDQRETAIKVHCLNLKFELLFQNMEMKYMAKKPPFDIDSSNIQLGFLVDSMTLPSGIKLSGITVDSDNQQPLTQKNIMAVTDVSRRTLSNYRHLWAK